MVPESSETKRHLMYAEVAWALVSLGIQVQLQILLNPDYLPDYPFVSYDYGGTITSCDQLIGLPDT